MGIYSCFFITLILYNHYTVHNLLVDYFKSDFEWFESMLEALTTSVYDGCYKTYGRKVFNLKLFSSKIAAALQTCILSHW